MLIVKSCNTRLGSNFVRNKYFILFGTSFVFLSESVKINNERKNCVTCNVNPRKQHFNKLQTNILKSGVAKEFFCYTSIINCCRLLQQRE